jgi:hypothetical protein
VARAKLIERHGRSISPQDGRHVGGRGDLGTETVQVESIANDNGTIDARERGQSPKQ